MRLLIITLIIILITTSIGCSLVPKGIWEDIHFASYRRSTSDSTILKHKIGDSVKTKNLLGCLAIRDISTLKSIQKAIAKIWTDIDFEFYEARNDFLGVLYPYSRGKDISRYRVYGCLDPKMIKTLLRLKKATSQ